MSLKQVLVKNVRQVRSLPRISGHALQQPKKTKEIKMARVRKQAMKETMRTPMRMPRKTSKTQKL